MKDCKVMKWNNVINLFAIGSKKLKYCGNGSSSSSSNSHSGGGGGGGSRSNSSRGSSANNMLSDRNVIQNTVVTEDATEFRWNILVHTYCALFPAPNISGGLGSKRVKLIMFNNDKINHKKVLTLCINRCSIRPSINTEQVQHILPAVLLIISSPHTVNILTSANTSNRMTDILLCLHISHL